MTMTKTQHLNTTTTTTYTMETKCDKCGHTWTYKGQYKYATCPSCLSKVEIRKSD